MISTGSVAPIERGWNLPEPNKPYQSIVVLGPTASGKTSLGVALARSLQGEIISVDSRQVYRGMDLGTGKDLDEYGEVPYHLIDILPPGSEYNLFEFMRDFKRAFSEIKGRDRLPIIVGGTGLYLDALVFGYHLKEVPMDPRLREELKGMSLSDLQERLISSNAVLHNETDLHSRTRLVRAIEIAEASKDTPEMDLPPISPLILGVHFEPEQLRKRIIFRLKQRLENGLVKEAKDLRNNGLSIEKMMYYGLEYKFLAQHISGELNLNDMTQKLGSAICQFAKRQRTWFRRMERKGARIHWLNPKGPMVKEALSLFHQGHLDSAPFSQKSKKMNSDD